MSITFFEILGSVLDRNVNFAAQQRKLSVEQVYERIVSEAQNNHTEWFARRKPNLNYYSQDCRLAYLYIVAAANANTFKHVLTCNNELRTYLLEIAKTKRELKVCAFGGGPGTELLGLAKFFNEQALGFSVNVDFQLLDKVKEWANTWYGIRDEVRCKFRKTYGVEQSRWPMIPGGNFIACDITDVSQLLHLGNVWDHDFYVANFLLSEIFDDDPGLKAFLREVANFAPAGTKFLFIERWGAMWQDRMHKIACDAGLILSPFSEERNDDLDEDERYTKLGNIYKAIGGQLNPRKGFNVVYSIGTKQ